MELVPSVFYHYTNYSGAMGIKRDNYIRRSGPSGIFGPGVYMTDMDPNLYSRDQILKNNYGFNFEERSGDDCSDRADWYVKIYRNDLYMSLLRKLSSRITGDSGRSIYVYNDIVVVNESQVMARPSYYASNPNLSRNEVDVRPLLNLALFVDEDQREFLTTAAVLLMLRNNQLR